ncbi:MAG: hypothetical protein IPM98_15735 [Lewinellaceae bacterium]|nr:hypothetical protein [Lewinellaceae bacterium]
MSGKAVLGYTILFENDPDFATAPAQVVKITQAIDPKMNPLSFRLGEFGFGSFKFDVPPNASFFSERLDIRDSLGIYLDVTAGVDIINNQFFWIFESIDPVTGLAPSDALKGFLLVNDSITHQGEGFVTYTVAPVAAAVTGDSIMAQASIVFDINAPLETNTWKNYIDAVAPVSVMDSLPAVAPGNEIVLSWSATDDPGGVGVGFYDLYVSKSGEPPFLYSAKMDTTAFTFTGEPAATYGFFVLSSDLVGNPEQPKDSVEQTTKLGNDSLLLLQPVAGSIYCNGSLLEVQWYAKGLSGIDVEIYDDVLGDFVPIQSNVNPFSAASPGKYLPVFPATTARSVIRFRGFYGGGAQSDFYHFAGQRRHHTYRARDLQPGFCRGFQPRADEPGGLRQRGDHHHGVRSHTAHHSVSPGDGDAERERGCLYYHDYH